MERYLILLVLVVPCVAFARGDTRKKKNPITIENAHRWIKKGEKAKKLSEKVAYWDKAVRILYFLDKDSKELKELVWRIVDVCYEQDTEDGDRLARIWLDRILNKHPDNERAKKLIEGLDERKKRRIELKKGD